MSALIQVRGISKQYGEGENVFFALKDLNCSVREGEFVIVMGRSGSGKSTFLHILGGLEPVSSGEVWIEGKEMKKIDEEPYVTEYRRKTIGFIFQFFNLISSLTALENVAVPLIIAGEKEKQATQRSEDMLRCVGLYDKRDKLPSELSGGQQQRVAIARALVHGAPIVLADEPTGNLDSKTSTEVMELLDDLRVRFNQTIVLVTHDPVVATYGDRVLFFQDGQIVYEMQNDQSGDRRKRAFKIMDKLHDLTEGTLL